MVRLINPEGSKDHTTNNHHPKGCRILMTIAWCRSVSIGCVLLVAQSGHCPITLTAQSVSPSGGGVVQSASTDKVKVVLLGSGAGPPVNLQQFGASTLIEAGGVRLLFDCGRGATMRLTQVGVPIGSISRLFLTHLHSDHVIQIPDLLLIGGGAGGGPPMQAGRTSALEVWGPEGTTHMMDHLQQAFAFDIYTRSPRNMPREGMKVLSHDIKEGVVFEEQGVKVTAFLVEHGPVIKPAFGYRVDYRGYSVALSGDTRVSENLIRFAKGVDVL
jgi:ribonuclease Z